MIDEFGEQVDFVLVYIAEAHPTDGWAYAVNHFEAKQANTITERADAAKVMFQLNVSCPVLLDGMDNALRDRFQSLPDRLYIVKDARVIYQGGEGPTFYDVDHTRSWLADYLASNSKKSD